MINLNKTLIFSSNHFVKPPEIHNFIHRFCGKLWKSPKYKRSVQKMLKELLFSGQ